MDSLQPIQLVDNNGKSSESGCFKVNLKRFDNALRHIACGIFHYTYGKVWLGEFKVITAIFMEMKASNSPDINERIQALNKEISSKLNHLDFIGENKGIFKYKLTPPKANQHAIHMVFYDEIEITVLLFNKSV